MWWLSCSSTSEGGLCGRGRNGVRCRVRPPRPARRLPRARLTVRLRTGCNCCLCRRSCYHRPCLVVLCLLLPPPPPSLVPFPFHPGPWTRDWDDPARSQIFTATLLGTGATAGCAPAAPAGLCVRRRWMPPVAAAGGNGSFSVGDVGIGADDDGDGDGNGDGEDNVNLGARPRLRHVRVAGSRGRHPILRAGARAPPSLQPLPPAVAHAVVTNHAPSHASTVAPMESVCHVMAHRARERG